MKLKDKIADRLEDHSVICNDPEMLPELLGRLEIRMKEAAKQLDFEEAASLRDRIQKLKRKMAD